MTVWLGSYLPREKPPLKEEECFIVWAKNEKEAAKFVDEKMGNVAKKVKLLEISEVGFVNFHVSSLKGQVVFTPPKEDLKNNVWINLNGVFLTDTDDSDEMEATP